MVQNKKTSEMKPRCWPFQLFGYLLKTLKEKMFKFKDDKNLKVVHNKPYSLNKQTYSSSDDNQPKLY